MKKLPKKEFARLIHKVLSEKKEITDSFNWIDKDHRDFVVCKLPVYVPAMPHVKVRLDLQVNVRKQPMKSSFTLIMRERIFSLDVNPGMTHNNNINGKRVVIRGSHWTQWPNNIAVQDDRKLEHIQWFNNFLDRVNISFKGSYEYPPYIPEQIGLAL